MRKEVLNENGLPSCRGVGKVPRNTVVERELAFLHQHHDGSRNELLPNRTRLKDRLRLDWHGEFHIGLAIALSQQNLPSAVNANSKTRDLLMSHLSGDEGVNGLETLWVKWHGGGRS